MTKFNPENKKSLTYGECLHPAMEITDESDAQQYLADYIAYIKTSPCKDGMAGEQIASANLGYFAGYFDNETRERVERLFKCSHPSNLRLNRRERRSDRRGSVRGWQAMAALAAD